MPALVTQRNNRFSRYLIDHTDIGQTGIHCRRVRKSVASDGRIDGKLDQWHELIEWLFFGRTSIETAGKVQRAELNGERPLNSIGIVHVSVAGLTGTRLEEQRLRSSVEWKFRGNRARDCKRAQPLELIRQITKTPAEGDAWLQCVGTIASNSFGADSSDSQIKLAEIRVS